MKDSRQLTLAGKYAPAHKKATDQVAFSDPVTVGDDNGDHGVDLDIRWDTGFQSDHPVMLDKGVHAAPHPAVLKKILAVTADIQEVVRDGFNTFHQYSYAKEAAILLAVRKSCGEHGLVVLNTVDDITTDFNTGFTRVKLRVTLADPDTGHSYISFWYGDGVDINKQGVVQDKGLYKAYTGAVKYALMKIFMVPTIDDPENFPDAQGKAQNKSRTGGQRRQQPATQQTKRQQPTGGAKPIPPDYTQRLNLLMNKTTEDDLDHEIATNLVDLWGTDQAQGEGPGHDEVFGFLLKVKDSKWITNAEDWTNNTKVEKAKLLIALEIKRSRK